MSSALTIDHLGAAELVVTDLDRSVAFYEEALALKVHRREGSVAAMGAGAGDLIVLEERPGAHPAGRHAGLYHYALLYPSRQELARGLRRLAETGTPLQGASDHGVSEALYLPDPDGNGIELYADRPRDQWPPPSSPDARVGMFTIPLDLEDLLTAVSDDDRPADPDPALVMGHMHLHVGDIADGVAFYRDVVGLDLMVELGGQAAFLATGGYHHQLGFNIWRGQGVGPAPADSVGLARWNVALASHEQLSTLRERLEAAGAPLIDEGGGFVARDPWQIAMRFTAV